VTPSSQRRRNRDSENKNFVCQYQDCDKAFFRKDHLVRHQRQKHGKPFGVDNQVIFYCDRDGCDKTFYKKSAVHRHVAMFHSSGNC